MACLVTFVSYWNFPYREFQKSHQELFQAWKAPTGVPRGKELWRLLFLVVIWTIWKERNSRCFEGKVSSKSSMVERTKFPVALWVSINPAFGDYTIDQIVSHWKELAFSRSM